MDGVVYFYGIAVWKRRIDFCQTDELPEGTAMKVLCYELN
jgi:hypothetical protein